MNYCIYYIFALECWVLGLPDRGSIFIRPPTEIWHRLSPIYPTSGPPSLLSLLSTLYPPLPFLSLSLNLSLSNVLIVAFTLSLSSLSIYLSPLPPQHIQSLSSYYCINISMSSTTTDDDDHDDGNCSPHSLLLSNYADGRRRSVKMRHGVGGR